MAKKKDNRGGKRKGAGRKPGPVPKEKMTVSVPKKYKPEIKEKTIKLAKVYEQRCLKEK